MAPMGPLVLICVLASLALAACGGHAPLPRGCLAAGADDVLTALRDAPRGVVLHDGTRISTCVALAREDADLQTVGAALTEAADRLGGRLARSDAAAFQLGYLIGAAERGAAHTGGVGSELTTRMRAAAALDGVPASRRSALLRGRAAGRIGG
jgi:hypothetical protein